MKRSNPSMNKPSVNQLDRDLNRYSQDLKSKNVYVFECPRCGGKQQFMEKDLKERVIKCQNCGYEEIFFACNYGIL